MARAKRTRHTKQATQPAAVPDRALEEQVVFGSGSLSLHDLFQQQAMRMLDRADLSEEQKQEILVAMACPCCGAGAMAYSVKLKK
jgi:hypothetical protein